MIKLKQDEKFPLKLRIDDKKKYGRRGSSSVLVLFPGHNHDLYPELTPERVVAMLNLTAGLDLEEVEHMTPKWLMEAISAHKGKEAVQLEKLDAMMGEG